MLLDAIISNHPTSYQKRIKLKIRIPDQVLLLYRVFSIRIVFFFTLNLHGRILEKKFGHLSIIVYLVVVHNQSKDDLH